MLEHIKTEEFKKQDEEIQKVLLDYFNNKPCLYEDIYYKTHFTQNIKTKYFIPLLTEGCLRKFIEDKTVYKVEVYIDYEGEYTIMLCRDTYLKYKTIETDLLQAYWKVALEIAKDNK